MKTIAADLKVVSVLISHSTDPLAKKKRNHFTTIPPQRHPEGCFVPKGKRVAMELTGFIATLSLHAAGRRGTLESLERSNPGRNRRESCRGTSEAAEQADSRHVTLTSLQRSGPAETIGSSVVAHRTQGKPTVFTALSHPFKGRRVGAVMVGGPEGVG